MAALGEEINKYEHDKWYKNEETLGANKCNLAKESGGTRESERQMDMDEQSEALRGVLGAGDRAG